MVRGSSLKDGHDPHGPWPFERCKHERCGGARITVGFSVDDDAWEAVTGDFDGCLCLTCFDIEAQARGISYELEALHAVT